MNGEASRSNMLSLLSAEEVRVLFHYRSRSAFHELLSKDRELQACGIRIGRRILFDPQRITRYLDHRRLTRLPDGE